MKQTGAHKERRGFYRFIEAEDRVWEMHWRHASKAEPAGWYLYGPAGVDVVGEPLGTEALATAERRAVQFILTYGAEIAVETAKSADRDEAWEKALRRVS